MVPTIDGDMHHFLNAGLYDALFVMQDTETDTFWNHITGIAMYGELAGHQLPLSNVFQMNVGQALSMEPETHIAISDRPFGGGRGRPGGGFGPDNANAQLMGRFIETLPAEEDTRRPQMDMGLGIWTEDGARRYYPMDTIREMGEALIDEFDGRQIAVYVDSDTSTPAAMYVDSDQATLDGPDVRLDDGWVVRSGVLIGPDGETPAVEQPLQIFTRWYGYALTFPDPEIYGQ